MINAYLSVLMDLIVLVFLGATIFYVLRLSKNLTDFKAQRRELDNVITNMISSIDQAERTVHNLKQTGAREAAELETLVMQSKSLAEELKIINEASESMAKRLENLAETNRKAAQAMQGHPSNTATAHDQNAQSVRHKGNASRRINRISSFADKKKAAEKDVKISSPVHPKNESAQKEDSQTRDFHSTLRKVNPENENLGFEEDKIPSFMIKDRDYDDGNSSEQDDVLDNLQSQAEKELFAALRGAKKNIGGEG